MAAKKITKMIFQLGTNNWQVPGEFAPGSGILHEAHHDSYDSMEGVKCYSIFPSRTQTSNRSDVHIFKIHHDIPICESVSPASSYRWHAMSEKEFVSYRERLEGEVYDFMKRAEEERGVDFSVAIAHHTFLNPIVMRNVLKTREAEGKPHCHLVVFVHGTALKMYVHEKAGKNPEEFPLRFLPFVQAQNVWKDVEVCFAISEQQIDAFLEIFPEYPKNQIVVSPNGVNQKIFHPMEGVTIANLLPRFKPAEGAVDDPQPLAADYDKLVVFVGKYADWKRIDSVLGAATIYEKNLAEKGLKVATCLIGTGPEADKKRYFQMVKDLGLKNTFFLGPQTQTVLAEFYTAASVCIFPSYKEPFGMVFIESMACGAPVIGARSGGPVDFVTNEVGELIKEHATDPHDLKNEEMKVELAEAVERALVEDWKTTKGPKGLALAIEKYSTLRQCTELLTNAEAIFAKNQK